MNLDPNAGPPVRSYVDCERCEWDHYADTDDETAMVAVLHVLVKHPEIYHQVTGRDPEEAAFRYREPIAAFRSSL